VCVLKFEFCASVSARVPGFEVLTIKVQKKKRKRMLCKWYLIANFKDVKGTIKCNNLNSALFFARYYNND
jgi:hypothetical protein